MTLEEREQIKAEILEEIKAEKKGMTAWHKYVKEELKPKLKSIIPEYNHYRKYGIDKLQQSLSQFVMVILNKNTMSIKESEIERAKKIAAIFIKAYQEAQKISKL